MTNDLPFPLLRRRPTRRRRRRQYQTQGRRHRRQSGPAALRETSPSHHTALAPFTPETDNWSN
jgi:hypothetical protein